MKKSGLTNLKIVLLSKFNEERLCGTVKYYIMCNDVILKNEYIENLDTREERTEIYSLYKALQFINKPCKIEIYTRMACIFNESSYKSSLDKDLLHNIKVISKNMEHELHFKNLEIDMLNEIYNLESEFSNIDINWRDSREVEKGIIRKVEAVKKVDISIRNGIITERNSMYADLDDIPGQRAWVPGSGGY